MKKCYFNFAKHAAMAALLVGATSCSDEEKNYLDDVYFTGNQSPVVVAPAAATATPGGTGSAAFNLTFDAASNWQISAKDFSDPSKTADWVSFFQNAGEEGSQMLGVYLAANTASEERAATIEVSCNGKSVALTLVQQAANKIANPNASTINGYKTVSKIEYCPAGSQTPSRTISFTYDSNGELMSEAITDIEGETTTLSGYDVTIESSLSNKVVITPADDVVNGATYAVINGKVAIGYNVLAVTNNSSEKVINFGYNGAANLDAFNGNQFSYDLNWSNGNMAAINCTAPDASQTNVAYSTELNDCNLDLNYFIGYRNAWETLPTGYEVLGAMNLLGVRSANLVSTANGNTFTYTSGVTASNGDNFSGITATGNSMTVKVYFAD